MAETRALNLLSDQEVEHYRRFILPAPARTFLAAHVLKRSVLALLAARQPKTLDFTENEWGKPELQSQPAPPLYFNLSHKPGLAVLLVSRHGPIGVDVEEASKPLDDIEHIAARFFAPEEHRELMALPPEARQERFYRLWTLKESYIKARGQGLSLGLSGFAFYFEREDIRIAFRPDFVDSEENWTFWQQSVGIGHLAAATARRIAGLKLQVKCWDASEISIRACLEYGG